MTSTTLEIYNALVDAGVAKEKAELAAKAVISREEAKEMLVTKNELLRAKNELIMWIVGSQIALVSLLLSVLK